MLFLVCKGLKVKISRYLSTNCTVKFKQAYSLDSKMARKAVNYFSTKKM